MRLTPSPRLRVLLRRLPAVNFYSLGEIVLLGVLAIQCARLFYAMVTPLGPLGDWRVASAGMGGSPIAILQSVDPFFRVSGPAAPATTVTSLQLTLFGTRIDGASGQSSAIIAGPDGIQNSVVVGEEIAPGVKLKAVAFDHVTIDRGGAAEELYIDQSGGPVVPVGATPGLTAPGGPTIVPGPPAGGGGPAVSASQLRSDIGFAPRIDGGRIAGLTVRQQGSGAAFRTIGLRDGDVVTAAGGQPIAGPADIDRILGGVTPGAVLPLTVERGQQTLSIVVTIRGQ